MVKTNLGLVNHATVLYKSGAVYLWGTFGKKVTKSLLEGLFRQYPEYYAQENRKARALANDIGKIGVDCCGLIKSYMFMESPASTPKYISKYDTNVGGMKSACSQKGSISNMPEIPGLLVFMGTHHVGIYIGNGYVIEAKGFNYGVVKTVLKNEPWDTWGKLSWINYGAAVHSTAPSVVTSTTPVVKTPVAAKKTVSYKVTSSRGLWLRTKPSTLTGVRKGVAEHNSIQEVSDTINGWGYIPSKKLWMSISSRHTKKV